MTAVSRQSAMPRSNNSTRKIIPENQTNNHNTTKLNKLFKLQLAMIFSQNLEAFKRLHHLISIKRTGTPKQFAQRMLICW